jgi:hypothetical protein
VSFRAAVRRSNDKAGQKSEVSNDFVTQEMKQVHQDSDTDYGYQK